MSEITNKIQDIINARALHLPVIQAQIEHLQNVQTKIEDLRKLIKDDIEIQLENKNGIYYNIISEDPKIQFAFDKVKKAFAKVDEKTPNGIICKLVEEQLIRLKTLEDRFKREAIRVAFIGWERQGKSTFLKTITGLNDKVIPAYSGDSCTGAVSVIHNQGESLRVDVQYFTLDEFLEIINQKIKNFYNHDIIVRQLSDIKTLPPFENEKASAEYLKFKQSYIEHYEDYYKLIGTGTKKYYDEDEIAKHVAQYEEFDHEVPDSVFDKDKNVFVRKYYKYVAVKNVDIFTPFRVGDTQMIELVDTIGIGGAADDEKVQQEMYRVLREDCDAAIDLWRPENVGAWPGPQNNIIQGLWDNLQDRDPSKWIVYILNSIPSGKFENITIIPSVLKKVTDILDLYKTKNACPVAWTRAVKGADLEDVTNRLISPLLDLIITNLPTLDSNLMADARQKGKDLYIQYASLVNDVENVLKSSMKHTGNATKVFNKLYKSLRDNFDTVLTTLNNSYKSEYLNPCEEVEAVLESVIQDLYETLPDPEEIDGLIAKGNALGTVYDIFSDKFCNNIYAAFESVSTDVIIPLRENVKLDVIKILFNEGRMGKIRLVGYDIANGPSVEWLDCLLKEKVNVDIYPALYDTLNFILSYHFNIEDAIEADVATCIGAIDKLNLRDFIQLQVYDQESGCTEGEFIFQELGNRVPQIQASLRQFKSRFALMPSHSFATRVNKFHIKALRDEQTQENLEEFYIDNEGAIWKEEFQNQANEETAFGQWNILSEELADLAKKDKFLI